MHAWGKSKALAGRKHEQRAKRAVCPRAARAYKHAVKGAARGGEAEMAGPRAREARDIAAVVVLF